MTRPARPFPLDSHTYDVDGVRVTRYKLPAGLMVVHTRPIPPDPWKASRLSIWWLAGWFVVGSLLRGCW